MKTPYESLLSARTTAEYAAAVDHEFRVLGCSTYSLALVGSPQIDGHSEWLSHYRMPAAYVDVPYGFLDQTSAISDPVMQWMKHCSMPIVWGAETYRDVGLGDIYDWQAGCGLASGISMAMHLPNGRHFVGGCDDASDVRRRSDLSELIARIQLLVVYAQAAAEHVYGLVMPDAYPALTPRELECLKWISAGKTAWETGRILSVKEVTVENYVKRVIQKLNCTSRTHAVSKAIRMGIL